MRIIDNADDPNYAHRVSDISCPAEPSEPGCLAVGAGLGSALQGDLCWLLVRAARGLGGAMTNALGALSLDTRGVVVLKTISNASAPNQLAIAHAAAIDKTTLVAVLDDLERNGLVRRVPDPNDRRARVVELTDDGRRMLGWAEAAGGDIQQTVLDALDPADRDALLRSLPLLINAIDRVTSGVDA
ncbi:MAG: hypothetical protein JWM12_3850 [Ilumatobacteraceae bacterium]|nr:hypothetical protein [Ilumatobacteraceae bacterium]